ncbi:hypothetical protein V6N13_107065 [Hibiscus sabdariffa]
MALLQPNEFTKLIVFLWNVCNWRNQKVHEEKALPPWLTVMNTCHLQQSYRLTEKSKCTTHNSNAKMNRWKRPRSGTVKINFDGSYHASIRAATIGVLARDSSSLVIACNIKFLPNALDASIVEAHACYEVILLGLDRGWNECLSLVNPKCLADLCTYGAHASYI